MLPRPDSGMTVEDERFAVRRETASVSPVERQRFLLAARHRDLVQDADARERAVTARGAEDHVLRIARPGHNLIVAGVKREPARCAAGGGHDEDVVVAVAIGGEGDPAAVRREARVYFARPIVGDPLHVRAVLVRDPDVTEIAEGDLARAIVRMTG